VSSIN